MTIEINKRPKTGFFNFLFNSIVYWGLLLFAFYFNYKFIDSNNLLDFIILLIVAVSFVAYIALLKEDITTYNNVSDDKIKAIEELLSKD